VSSCTPRPPETRPPLPAHGSSTPAPDMVRWFLERRGRAIRRSTSGFPASSVRSRGFGPTSTRPITIREVRSGAAHETPCSARGCAKLNVCAGQDVRIIDLQAKPTLRTHTLEPLSSAFRRRRGRSCICLAFGAARSLKPIGCRRKVVTATRERGGRPKPIVAAAGRHPGAGAPCRLTRLSTRGSSGQCQPPRRREQAHRSVRS
jgi:hypothetical protein